ncbi:MAG: helix-turn-helix domain-containing protein [Dactylosporangium sp.]|nr:helix-turn-helix domain-containing protein [Dactylosporangium sp.]NNJ62805.1 helix-turn-helix domain-containing protein [Dactylosporangium sp.]
MDAPGSGPVGEPDDTPRHRALASPSRVGILRLLRASEGGLTTRAVATATGLHLTTAREHLDRLVRTGLVERARQHTGRAGRPAWRYWATPAAGQPAQEPSNHLYQDMACALTSHLGRIVADPSTAGSSAGEAWGRRLAAEVPAAIGADPVAGLVTVLERLGFAPRIARNAAAGQRTGDPTTALHLHACPFLDIVAGGDPAVVCGMHLGVVRGALDALGADCLHPEVAPFSAPAACVIRLRAQDTPDGDIDR